MISVKNLSKSYDRISYAVDDISFNVNPGEILILAGESGCGKTTTLKMINRLIEPSSGEIIVNDVNILDLNPVELRRRIGYVFQEIGLFPHMTISENVGIVPKLLGWSRANIKARVDELMELTGLDPDKYAQKMPSELSGGQKQRVGVARALAARPDVMLMDEPFGALDPITRSGIQDEFKNLQTELKLTVIMVTHDMMEALILADHVAIMQEGKIVVMGTPGELMSKAGDAYAERLLHAPRQQSEKLAEILKRGDKK
ncbi:MAG TPA: ATP-binding cassette domain-containing protein [candidate division Zixibacteria bacterium]|nr:ATP-binding cassette domain-containing protein [candidate division Zixibacteria bacterium]HEQ99391.1 ATP-binding cassette domain-containing protein [candidate division Zixibacteria bacterium]